MFRALIYGDGTFCPDKYLIEIWYQPLFQSMPLWMNSFPKSCTCSKLRSIWIDTSGHSTGPLLAVRRGFFTLLKRKFRKRQKNFFSAANIRPSRRFTNGPPYVIYIPSGAVGNFPSNDLPKSTEKAILDSARRRLKMNIYMNILLYYTTVILYYYTILLLYCYTILL